MSSRFAAPGVIGRAWRRSAPRERRRRERPQPQPIDRSQLLARLRDDTLWDAVIIGGGATGLGIAVDAAARGLKVALIERRTSPPVRRAAVPSSSMAACVTWRKATSTWSARRSPSAPPCSQIAPHIVRPLEFVVPVLPPLERRFCASASACTTCSPAAAHRSDAAGCRAMRPCPPAWRARRGPARRCRLLGRPVRRCAHGNRARCRPLRARRCADQLCALCRVAIDGAGEHRRGACAGCRDRRGAAAAHALRVQCRRACGSTAFA